MGLKLCAVRDLSSRLDLPLSFTWTMRRLARVRSHGRRSRYAFLRNILEALLISSMAAKQSLWIWARKSLREECRLSSTSCRPEECWDFVLPSSAPPAVLPSSIACLILTGQEFRVKSREEIGDPSSLLRMVVPPHSDSRERRIVVSSWSNLTMKSTRA